MVFKTTTEYPGRGVWFQGWQEGSRAVLGMALCCPAWLGMLQRGSPPAPPSTHNYPAVVNEALVPDIKFCGKEISRILIQPSNAPPGVLRGWPWGWNPNPSSGQAAEGLHAGDRGRRPKPGWGLPWRWWGRGGTASPQSPICAPSIPTVGQGLPDALVGLCCLSSPPFCKEDKKEREATFWVEFFGVWLFRFPSSHRGSKEGAALCWVCQRRRVCERDAGCREGALRHASISREKAGTEGMEGTQRGQRGHSTQEHPGLLERCCAGWEHALPAGCILRDAVGARRERRTAEGAAGQEERGHHRDIAGDTGGDRGLGLPWAGMQPRGPEGSDIPGCGGSDAIPRWETLAPALTSVPHWGPGGFPGMEFNPKKHQEIQGGQSLPGEAALF